MNEVNKYQNGKIYRLVCNTTGLQYYGSTCEVKLCKRLAHHKASYKLYLKGKYHFVSSFDIIKNDNYQIVLIENHPCNNIDELHQRERFYIENNECVNIKIPNRTKTEYNKTYCEENYDKIKEYNKEWREENKDIIKERKKEWYEENKNERKVYREENKEHIKEINKRYYEKNKDIIRERQKQYYEDKKKRPINNIFP